MVAAAEALRMRNASSKGVMIITSRGMRGGGADSRRAENVMACRGVWQRATKVKRRVMAAGVGDSGRTGGG